MSVQAFPEPHSMGYGGFLPGLEWPGPNVDHPSPFSADVKNEHPHTCITPLFLSFHSKKGKVIPLQARCGPEVG